MQTCAARVACFPFHPHKHCNWKKGTNSQSSFTFFSLHAIRCLPANKLSAGGGVGLEIRSNVVGMGLIYFQINFCSDIDKQVGGWLAKGNQTFFDVFLPSNNFLTNSWHIHKKAIPKELRKLAKKTFSTNSSFSLPNWKESRKNLSTYFNFPVFRAIPSRLSLRVYKLCVHLHRNGWKTIHNYAPREKNSAKCASC